MHLDLANENLQVYLSLIFYAKPQNKSCFELYFVDCCDSFIAYFLKYCGKFSSAVSTPSVVLTGYSPPPSWPGLGGTWGGTPPLSWPRPGGVPYLGTPWQGTPLGRVPPGQGTTPAEYTPGRVPPGRVPPLAGPGRVPSPGVYPMEFWVMLQSIMGYGYPLLGVCPMAFWVMLQSIMGYGYPPPLWTNRWMDRHVSKHYLPVVLRTRVVISFFICNGNHSLQTCTQGDQYFCLVVFDWTREDFLYNEI